MKILLLFMLLASVATVIKFQNIFKTTNVIEKFQAQNQNTEFVNYLLRLQVNAKSYYDSMQISFRDARDAAKRYLVQLNTAGVSEFTEGKRKGFEIISTTTSFRFIYQRLANDNNNQEHDASDNRRREWGQRVHKQCDRELGTRSGECRAGHRNLL